MFESLVVTLREGVEAALIVAIVLAYLRKVGRSDLNRSVFLGLATAAAASIGGAALFSTIEINQEAFEGWTMLAGSVFIASMVAWMWRTGRHLKGEIESRLGRVAASQASGFSPAIFIFVFLMVVREGIETVLLLGAVRFDSSSVMSFGGALIGIAAAILFGVLFVKGSLRIDLRKFFTITSIILIVVAVQLFISGLHELSESMILPASEDEMAVIGPIVKNSTFFYVIILALTTFLVLWQRTKVQEQPSPDANPAERRKQLSRARRERALTISLASLSIVAIALLTTQFVYSMRDDELSAPEAYYEGGKNVRIPISQVDDGKLHRFVYRAPQGEVRFIIIKLKSGNWGVALDACLICGDKGYYQEGLEVICKNCVAAINPVTIGQSGGCNPIPVSFFLDESDIVVVHPELDAAAQYFGRQPSME
jgi:FTR1 family protein